MHRRAVGVVEFDSLMRLKVAAYSRAEAIGLVDVRLVGERDRAAEPGVFGARGGSGNRQASGIGTMRPRIHSVGPRVGRVSFPRATAVVGKLGDADVPDPK